MSRRSLVIWHNLNYDTYYYKFTSMTYHKYCIGDKNQYNHEVILVLDSDEVQPIVERHYFSIKNMVLTPVIKLLKFITVLLQKINNR